MGQLNFAYNFNINPIYNLSFVNNSVSFWGFNVYDSVSLNTINFPVNESSGAVVTYTISLSLGLYSLNGSSLSIANSASLTQTIGVVNSVYFLSLSTVSATQNITPGTWYWGLHLATAKAGAGGNILRCIGQSTFVSAENAFPGTFIGGAMTASTNALPSSYATSDLDVIGQNAMSVPSIIISS